MARILVQADDEQTVLLDERDVRPAHVNDEHSAAQLLQRLEWAVTDEAGVAASAGRAGDSG